MPCHVLSKLSTLRVNTPHSLTPTEEMTQVRETAASENCTGTSLADILQSALPADNVSLPPVSCNASNSTPTSSNSESNNKHNHVSVTVNMIL